MNYKLITTLVAVGLAVIFIIQNVEVVEIRFLFWSFAMSRALLMFFLLALGIIAGWFMGSIARQRKIKTSV
jgi:uncharacterized integral membrane protein